MDDQLRTQFEAAGWRPGRSVAADSALDAYRSEGYQVWPALEAFLSEYSGLTFSGSQGSSPVWIDGRRAVGDIDREWTQAYEELIDTTIVPVGGYHLMTVFLGHDGRLFGGYDVEFGPLADDLPALVDTLANHRPMPHLTLRVVD